MTLVSKNAYIDKLNDIMGEHDNTYHRTIKMKPIDVKDNKYIDSKKEVNDRDPKFEFGYHVKISKYKNIFAKGYTPNYMSYRNVMIIHLIAGLIKKIKYNIIVRV